MEEEEMDEQDVLNDPDMVIHALLEDGTELSIMMQVGREETVLIEYMHSLKLSGYVGDVVVAIKFPEGVVSFDDDISIGEFFP